jgi:hypothetical protein
MIYNQNALLFVGTDFLLVVLSSESLLLLDEAALLIDFCTGVDVDNGLVGATTAFFFLPSSLDESLSDEVSFFLVTGVTKLLATGVAGARKQRETCKRCYMDRTVHTF